MGEWHRDQAGTEDFEFTSPKMWILASRVKVVELIKGRLSQGSKRYVQLPSYLHSFCNESSCLHWRAYTEEAVIICNKDLVKTIQKPKRRLNSDSRCYKQHLIAGRASTRL